MQSLRMGRLPATGRRYFNQLRVLAQLRNLGIKLKETMDSIAKYNDEEKDVLYLRGLDKGETRGEAKGEARGEAKGEEKAKISFVRNLLAKTSLTIEQVADIAGVSVEFVRQVQQG